MKNKRSKFKNGMLFPYLDREIKFIEKPSYKFYSPANMKVISEECDFDELYLVEISDYYVLNNYEISEIYNKEKKRFNNAIDYKVCLLKLEKIDNNFYFPLFDGQKEIVLLNEEKIGLASIEYKDIANHCVEVEFVDFNENSVLDLLDIGLQKYSSQMGEIASSFKEKCITYSLASLIKKGIDTDYLPGAVWQEYQNLNKSNKLQNLLEVSSIFAGSAYDNTKVISKSFDVLIYEDILSIV